MFDEAKDVKIGDVILAVNGVPIEIFREKYAYYIAASTPQAMAAASTPDCCVDSKTRS